MKKSDNPNDILRETAVFDYVAGHQSDDNRRNFERMMTDDKALQRAVEAEQRLRDELLADEKKTAHKSAINHDNIDRLFARLDSAEKSLSATQTGSPTRRFNQRRWLGVAASIALVAVVLTMLPTNQPDNRATDEFTLLSDNEGKPEIDFNTLVLQHKIAQVWIPADLPAEQITQLFERHNLKVISRAGAAWVVTSQAALSKEKIAALEASKVIEKVSLIDFNGLSDRAN